MADPAAGENFDDDEEVDQKGTTSHAPPFDPAKRTLHAQIQFYAQNQYYQQLRQLCTRALQSDPSNHILQFWQAFAAHKCGDHEACINILTPLQEEKDLALPTVALLLTAHNSKPGKDKKLLLELKGKLKVVSKQSTEASLQLAGRYFLYTNKIPKARQCIEKVVAKDKKNVELLALFGWIYLQTGEEKYVEKSMQVFKKAAKLSLPNFDIAALMGRARYFEVDGKIAKSIQALDSIVKIYPNFLPAYEEKLRLLALQGKWKDVSKLRADFTKKRSAVLGADEKGESLVVSFVNTLEVVTSTSNSQKHLEALRTLKDSLEREEPNSQYWIWSYVQLFSRLIATKPAKGSATAVQFLLEWLQPVVTASKAQKGGISLLILFEQAYLALLKEDFPTTTELLSRASQIVLTQEKAEKDEGGDGDDGAKSAQAPKVNEDERLAKSQAYSLHALSLLKNGRTQEAKQVLDQIPEDARTIQSASSAGDQKPQALSTYLFVRALISQAQGVSGGELAQQLLDAIDAHMSLLRDRSQTDGVLTTSTPTAVQGVNKYFLLLDPLCFSLATITYLNLVKIQIDPSTGILTTKTRSADAETHPELLTQLHAALRHATSTGILPGSAELQQSLAIIAWLDGEQEAALATIEKLQALDAPGGNERVSALKELIQSSSGAVPTPKKVAPAAASSASSSGPSSAPNAPNTAQRKQIRASLGEEVGFAFDDEDDAAEALFKDAADEVDAGNEESDRLKAEKEAQQLLDEMESRAHAATKKKEADLAIQEELRQAREAAKKKAEAMMAAQAEQEAKAALEKASKKDVKLAEQKKQEEIAALRLAREQEKRRQQEEIERAEEERLQAREQERQERLARDQASSTITPIQAFTAGPEPLSGVGGKKPTPLQTGLKWNRPPEESPSMSNSNSVLSPLSLQSGGGYPSSSPLSPPITAGFRNNITPVTSSNTITYAGFSSNASTPSNAVNGQLTQQQLAHNRQLELQRSDEARIQAEKKEKIMLAGQQIDQAKKFTKVAFWGEVFLKHGRSGKPHERNVTLEVTGSELKFDWSSGQLKAHKNDIQLVEGKGTPVFQRATAEKTKAERCFSIVTANRTLDLEAPNDQARDYWVTGIKLLLKYLK